MKKTQTNISRSGAKWLPGAMAVASTAASHAATVQITLSGNFLNSYNNQLVADLTGDGADDVSLDAASYTAYQARVHVNGDFIQAKASVFRASIYNPSNYSTVPITSTTFNVDARFAVGAFGEGANSARNPLAQRYLNPITFTDSRINGNASTQGWLEVRAFNSNTHEHTVEFTRLIFDDASTTRPVLNSIPGVLTTWNPIPEPSSFALLTLGAAGLLARRRRKQAA